MPLFQGGQDTALVISTSFLTFVAGPQQTTKKTVGLRNCSAPQNITFYEIYSCQTNGASVDHSHGQQSDTEIMFVLNDGATDMHYWFLTCNMFRVRGGHKLINLLTDGVNSNVTDQTL